MLLNDQRKTSKQNEQIEKKWMKKKQNLFFQRNIWDNFVGLFIFFNFFFISNPNLYSNFFPISTSFIYLLLCIGIQSERARERSEEK